MESEIVIELGKRYKFQMRAPATGKNESYYTGTVVKMEPAPSTLFQISDRDNRPVILNKLDITLAQPL